MFAGNRRWVRWGGPVLAAAAVAAIVMAVVMITDDGSSRHGSTPVASASNSSTPAASASNSSTPRSTATVGAQPLYLQYVPLWPYNTYDHADNAPSSTDTLPRPLPAPASTVALRFTREYLGFNEIDRVTTQSTDSEGAHVGVGYADPNGGIHTAAVLHLVPFGTSATAPWEVVGSDDTTFSFEIPAYGSTIKLGSAGSGSSAVVTVGGHLTGVDESIHVWARDLTSVLARSCCQPAGGQNAAWTYTVSLPSATRGVLTLVASTGGHLLGVERFAIQGIRTG